MTNKENKIHLYSYPPTQYYFIYSLPGFDDKPTLPNYKHNTHIFLYPAFSLFFLKLINLFIFDCVGSSFLCEGFLQLQQAGATLHRGARASHCRGLSCCGAQAPDTQAQ